MKTWAFGEGLTSTDLNGNFTEHTNDISVLNAAVSALSTKLDALVPIGKSMFFNDFNGLLTVNGLYWAAENGQTINDIASPLNGKTLDDVSGRYIVGFGEDGAGDINSAAWASTPVGNEDHQIDIEHAHGAGDLKFQTAYLAGSGSMLTHLYLFNSSGANLDIPTTTGLGYGERPNMGLYSYPPYLAGTNLASQYTYTKDGSGSTGLGLSSTQSIQPRSVRKRSYIRYK